MFYRFRRTLRNLFPELARELLYVHDLKIIPECTPKLNVRILKLDNGNIFRINDVKKFDDNAFFVRFERGDMCYATENSENKIVSYHWIQNLGIHYIEQANLGVEINDRERWVYHVRVREDFQGKGIARFVYRKILKDSKREGFNKVFIYTNFKNFSNRKSLEFLGFYAVRIYYSIKFKSKYFLIYSKNQ